MAARRYIEVEFQPGGRPYLYHNEEGQPLEVGSQVNVTTPAGAVRTVTITKVYPNDYDPASETPWLSNTKPAFIA